MLCDTYNEVLIYHVISLLNALKVLIKTQLPMFKHLIL